MFKNIDESVKDFDNIVFEEVWEDRAYFLMQSTEYNKDKLFCYKILDDDDFCVAQWLSSKNSIPMTVTNFKESINYKLFLREMEKARQDSKKVLHDLTIHDKEADSNTPGEYTSGEDVKAPLIKHWDDWWDDDGEEFDGDDYDLFDDDSDKYSKSKGKDEFGKSSKLQLDPLSLWKEYHKNYIYTPPKKVTGLAKDLKKSDTLVIHCEDRSTDMLSQIYKGRGWDVLRNGNIDENELRDLLNYHDRIIMLGHGTPSGLINKQGSGFVINRDYADILREKDTYAIWCYSYEFAKSIGIKPGYFWTSNIPSEVGEEIAALGHAPLDKQEMLDNITYWAKLCAESIDMPPREAIKYIKERYTGTDDCSEYIRNHMMIT